MSQYNTCVGSFALFSYCESHIASGKHPFSLYSTIRPAITTLWVESAHKCFHKAVKGLEVLGDDADFYTQIC